MTRKIKTAVIGVGNMGKNHARVYKEISSLTAVVDTNPNRGIQMADEFDVKWYKTVKELIKKEKIDALSIVVPTSKHSSIAKITLANKIPTLIEKPIAPTVKQGTELINLAKKFKTFLMVGHIERFNPAVVKVKGLIEKGKLGDIVSLLAIRVGVIPPAFFPSDVVIDLSIHDIDVFNFLLDQFPKKVTVGKNKIFNQNISDSAALLLE